MKVLSINSTKRTNNLKSDLKQFLELLFSAKNPVVQTWAMALYASLEILREVNTSLARFDHDQPIFRDVTLGFNNILESKDLMIKITLDQFGKFNTTLKTINIENLLTEILKQAGETHSQLMRVALVMNHQLETQRQSVFQCGL